MKSRMITISREFGSGGRTFGKMVAQELNTEAVRLIGLSLKKCKFFITFSLRELTSCDSCL